MISSTESTATLEVDSPPEFGPSAESAAAGHARVLLFSLAGHRHCAGLGSVREIIPVQAATSLPGAPDHVRGLINLRGSIVTVIDATMCECRVAGVVVDEVHDLGLLDKDIPIDALLDLGAMVQMALA
jgi:hypothetical protein